MERGAKSISQITAIMKGTAEKPYLPQELNYLCMRGNILAYYKDGSLDISYFRPIKDGGEREQVVLLTYVPPVNGGKVDEPLSLKATPDVIAAARSDLEIMMKTEFIDPNLLKDLQAIHSRIFPAITDELVKR